MSLQLPPNPNPNSQSHPNPSPIPNPNPNSNPSPNPNPSPRPPKEDKEEGELSSSENDDHPDFSAIQSVDIVPPSTGNQPTIPPDKISLGKASTTDSSVPVLHGRSMLPKYEKSTGANQLPHTSASYEMTTLLQCNNNLVISFSDEESSSDSEVREDLRLQKKARTSETPGKQKPTNITENTLRKLGQKDKNETQTLSKPLASNHPCTSSMTIKQTGNFRTDIDSPLLVRQGSLEHKVENQECKFNLNASKSLKLQDLRQQIAIRESELKLKTAQQNKQSFLSPLNVNMDPGRRQSLKSADASHLEPKLPPKKKLKFDTSRNTKHVELGASLDKSSFLPKQLILENNKRYSVDVGQKASSSGGTESNGPRMRRQGSKVNGGSHSEGMSRLAFSSSLANQNLPSTRMNPHALLQNTMGVELDNAKKVCGDNSDGAIPDQTRWEHNIVRGKENHEAISRNQGSTYNEYLSRILESENFSKHSLFELEESADRELEKAQQHRRNCEIEERNALGAYRKAQRALLEANAKCVLLYRERELYSSQLRTLMMDGSDLCWSSKRFKPFNFQRNSNDVCENVNLVPSLSHHLQTECNQFNHMEHASDTQHFSRTPFDSSFHPPNALNVGSEPCSEPDASTSEPFPCKGRNVVSGDFFSTDEPIMSDEDEGVFPPNQDPTPPDNDSLLLEATLRSELFARLHKRNILKGNESGSEKVHMANGDISLSEEERIQPVQNEGLDQLRTAGASPALVEDQIHTKSINDASHSEHLIEEGHSQHLIEEGHSTAFCVSPSSCMRSAFCHLKVICPLKFIESNRRVPKDTIPSSSDANSDSSESNWTSSAISLYQEKCEVFQERDTGSYSSNVSVDPFWPLCMYELRGRCNNDQCPWQHFNRSSNEMITQEQGNDASGCQVELASSGQKWNTTSNWPACHVPTYLVSLDILKAESSSYRTIVAWTAGRRWQKCFSLYLVIPSNLKKALIADDSVLLKSDGRVEVNGCWSRQSSYYQNRNSVVNWKEQASIDNGHALEVALLLVSQEVDELQGKKRALSFLLQSLGKNPALAIHWIAYLIIYHCKTKTCNKNDYYLPAVKHNQGSYELWLMYINSRIKIDDRLTAYEDAILALSQNSPVFDGNRQHASSCILDLFLQMMDCLCMSQNTDKAIQIAYEVTHPDSNSNERFSLLLNNILLCLTFSDKCVFWVCCVYLVIYRKLPDAIVQQFECAKEPLLIEWPPVPPRDGERQRAVEMMDFIVSSVESHIQNETLHSEAYSSAQHFALSHINCMVALDGFERNKQLLDRYKKKYPSCFEIVILTARAENCYSANTSFLGFEDALNRWPKESPGSQCIWNQYAEYALQNGPPNWARELMDRWFTSIWKVRYPENKIVEGTNGEKICHSPRVPTESNSDASASTFDQLDDIYELVNLSLYHMLHNQHAESLVAMDQALKVATPQDYKHCVREHAAIWLKNASEKSGGVCVSEIIDVLGFYINDERAFAATGSLSREFIACIDKPRVRQLINNMLCPISAGSLVLNSALDAWFGPSLLPPMFEKPKDLVDFVEAVLELSPSNYRLAISVCNLVTRSGKSPVFHSDGLLFWSGSLLVITLSHAVPVAPEYIWVEAARVLQNISGIDLIKEGFYERALAVYPFSLQLWKLYKLCKTAMDVSLVLDAAKERGIELD